MNTLKAFFDFGISLPVHSLKIVMTTTASPRYTPRMVYLFLDIKDGTDVINLEVVCEMTLNIEGRTHVSLGEAGIDRTDKGFE